MDTTGQSTPEVVDVSYDKLFRRTLNGFNREDVLQYLERMSRARRKESERYAAHVRSLESNVERLTHELTDAKAAPQPLSRTELSASEVAASENEALRSEIEVLRLRLRELEEASPVKVAPQSAPSGDAGVRAECARLADALASATAERDALLAANETLTSDNAALADERCTLEDEKSSLSGQVEQLRRTCDAAKAGLDAAASEKTALLARVDALEAGQRTTQARAAALEEKLRGSDVGGKARLDTLEADAARRARAIEDAAAARAAALEQTLEGRVAELRALLEQVSAGLDNTTKAIYEELSVCGTRYSALRRTADDLRASLKEFHVQ